MERPGELMSIKAFSEAAGRSQQAIYKQIRTRLASYVHEKEGQKYIERRALAEVFKIGEIQPEQPKFNSTKDNLFNPDKDRLQEEVSFLRAQLLVKDKQIEAQQAQISQLTSALEHTTASLQAAQALHAGTMQAQLGAGEPQNDIQTEVPTDAESRELNPPRKWWQFWK